MKKSLSFLFVWFFALAAAPVPPHWSKTQMDRLDQWLESSARDGLSTGAELQPALRQARRSGDESRADAQATRAALALLAAYRDGCCNAALRDGWEIAADPAPADPQAALADALAHDRLDALFAAARPAHPYYLAMRVAYAQETDAGRRAVLAANMDRWRWMPRDLGKRYLLVNAAAFEASLWEDGQPSGRWRVVVGKTKSPTPVFRATVSGVTLNPWWEIPSSIAAESIAAMVARDPAAAAKKGYVREGGRYRQKPGPTNSLGQMKLVMPNPYSVYLHDSPAKALFGRDVRAFSHGCVRVGDAMGLVTALLAPQAGWDRARVDAVVASGQTTTVSLDTPIPVYVAYFTAEPDENGGIRYFPDVYKRDAGAATPTGDGRCDVPAPETPHPDAPAR